MSKRWTATVTAVAMSLGFAAAQTASAQEVHFTFATTNGPKDFSSQSVMRWKEALEDRSNGEIVMDFIPGGALGGDQQLLQQLATNEIQMHVAGPVVVHRLLQQYQCMEAEYVYEDQDHGYRVWTGPLGEEVSKKLEDEYGITIVAVGLRGARHITSNKPIKTPDDLQGVKIRVTNPLRAKIFEAYGALPAPLSIAELYGALRQGVFDAEENPIPTIWGNKFYEVQDYINLTGHVISYYVFAANKSFYEGLSEDHRKIFDDTLAEAIAWLNEQVRTEEDSLLQQMVDQGYVQVIEPDVAKFREIAEPIVQEFAAENCREGLLEEIAQHADGQ